MKVRVIDTGFFKLDGGAMFGVVPKVMWDKLNPADDKNLCTWAMRCLLVEEGERKVLIDCGLGNKQSEKFFSYYEPHGEQSLEGSLSQLGIEVEEITDVFLTHLHFDHCGGAVKYNEKQEPVTAFPNATYWSNKVHWDWAVDPNPREKASFLKENILPIQQQGQLKFLDVEDGVELFKGFRVHFVNGHTEAMMIPHIDVGDNTLIYLADLIPSRWHISIPFVMAYDMQPLVTINEKRDFLQEAAEKDYVLFYEHDPEMPCSRVKREGDRFSMGEVISIEDLG